MSGTPDYHVIEREIPNPTAPAIDVQITDESEAHCLKLVFRARNVEQPLEIFLHTTQAIDLAHKLSLAICELHHRDSAMLLRLKAGAAPLIVTP